MYSRTVSDAEHEVFLADSDFFVEPWNQVQKITQCSTKKAHREWQSRNWEGHCECYSALLSLGQANPLPLCIWTYALDANPRMSQKMRSLCWVLTVPWCWEEPPKIEGLNLHSGATIVFAAVTLFPLGLHLTLCSLPGWEHLPKFINCVYFSFYFSNTSKEFLLYLNTKGYFPVLGRLIIPSFIFSSEYVFDTSLVIRIEAWHCRKQQMFACISFTL